MKAFFLGAGASCGTLKATRTPVPVAAQFGAVLRELDPGWTGKYPGLFKVVSHLGLPLHDWGLEPVWTCMDYYAKLAKAIPRPRDWSGESRQLKKALLKVYGKRCDRAADLLPRTDSYTLGDILQNELTPGDVLISFNYDTIVERLADCFDRPIRSVDAKERGGAITLAKPHGSVSWTMDFRTCRVSSASADGGPLLDSLSLKDVDSCREPLVLGTVPIKSELIKEVQQHLKCSNRRSWTGVFDTITKQWKAVVEAIRDADSVIIVGYSLPREDQYGRFLIQEGMRLRKRKPTVEFYELRDKECERAGEIKGAFGVEPTFRGEVLPPE